MPPPARVIHTRCIQFSKEGAARGTLPIAGKHVPLLGALTQSITARTQAARRKSPAHAAFRAPHSPIRREQPWHVPLSPGLMHRLQTLIGTSNRVPRQHSGGHQKRRSLQSNYGATIPHGALLKGWACPARGERNGKQNAEPHRSQCGTREADNVPTDPPVDKGGDKGKRRTIGFLPRRPPFGHPPKSFALRAGMIAVIPQGAWHRASLRKARRK